MIFTHTKILKRLPRQIAIVKLNDGTITECYNNNNAKSTTTNVLNQYVSLFTPSSLSTATIVYWMIDDNNLAGGFRYSAIFFCYGFQNLLRLCLQRELFEFYVKCYVNCGKYLMNIHYNPFQNHSNLFSFMIIMLSSLSH